MNPSADKKLYTCTKCKEEFPLDLDPKILEIVGGSVVCDACSRTHLFRSDASEEPPAEQDSRVSDGEEADSRSAAEEAYRCGDTSSGASRDPCPHLRPPAKLSVCGACGKTFATRAELRRHSLTHTGEKPHACSSCGKAFARSCYLKAHFRIHTGEKPYSCGACGKSFARPSGLQVHACPERERPHRCGDCPAAFFQRYQLQIHSRIHTGERPYACEVCSKAFTQQGALQQHMRFHTGERPYACDQCDMAFSRKTYLRDHMRRHTGEKPHACGGCGAAFAQRHQLSAHRCPGQEFRRSGRCTTMYVKAPTLTVRRRARAGEGSLASDAPETSLGEPQLRSGTEEKNQNCGEGTKVSSAADDPKLHPRAHAERRTFECDVCKKSFTKRTNLKLHQWRCHELDWNRLKYVKNKD